MIAKYMALSLLQQFRWVHVQSLRDAAQRRGPDALADDSILHRGPRETGSGGKVPAFHTGPRHCQLQLVTVDFHSFASFSIESVVSIADSIEVVKSKKRFT